MQIDVDHDFAEYAKNVHNIYVAACSMMTEVI